MKIPQSFSEDFGVPPSPKAMAGQAAVKFSGSVMSGNREFKEFREFREIAPDCTATGHISALSRNFDHILYQQDSRVSVRLSLTSSAVICFILKLLILLKFLIVCHALPHAYGFAVIPSGMRTPWSIPTFGFCRAKNESYIKRFGKR